MTSSSTYLGIDIGGTKTAVSISCPQRGILEKTRFETDPDHGPKQAIEKIIACGQRLSQRNKDHRAVTGVGISVGAMFNPEDGRFGEAPHLPGWTNFPLVSEIEKAFELPVAADNDANACALAEWKFGTGQGLRHLAFLTFGTGLGAGLILNGQLYGGSCNLAGEIGAVRVAADGPPVRDKPGCLEGFASGAGIAGLVERALADPQGASSTCLIRGASARDVAVGARAGDPLCLEIFAEAGTRLGQGLSILLDLLNLEMILLGSIFARCEDLLRPAMEAELARDAIPAARSACQILPSGLGEEVGDFAAMAVIHEFLEKKNTSF